VRDFPVPQEVFSIRDPAFPILTPNYLKLPFFRFWMFFMVIRQKVIIGPTAGNRRFLLSNHIKAQGNYLSVRSWKEMLGRGVGSNTGGDNNASMTSRPEQLSHPLGKDRIGVDDTVTGKGILISFLRTGAWGARAISRSRLAKNSCSCSLIRSHGGLPSTTWNPPSANTSGKLQGPVEEAVPLCQGLSMG